MARTTVKLPKVSDAVDEVLVLEWLVVPGSELTQGEPIVRVETDKVEIEIPSPVSGILVEIVAGTDALVPTGSAMCVIET